MCCPALSGKALSAFAAHWKFQTGISIPAILPHRLEERWFCPCLQGAPHPLLNPSFKPLFCVSSNTKLTAVWHLDVAAIPPHAMVTAHHPGGPGCLSPSPSPTCTPGEAIPPPCGRDQLYPLRLGSTWCNRTPGSNTSSGSGHTSPIRGKSEPPMDQALSMQKKS